MPFNYMYMATECIYQKEEREPRQIAAPLTRNQARFTRNDQPSGPILTTTQYAIKDKMNRFHPIFCYSLYKLIGQGNGNRPVDAAKKGIFST